MTIEDRVRRVLAEAVADEPSLRGAPLEHATRRRRRPVMAGAVALALVLVAVVALAAVRSREHPLPSTISTKGWTTWTDTAGNLRFRHPPDWVVRPKGGGLVRVAPPEHAAGATADLPPFAVGIRAVARGYYIGEVMGVNLTRGRLQSGQAYVVYEEDPASLVPPPEVPATSRSLAELPRRRQIYTIDWGRSCRTAADGQRSCSPDLVMTGIMAASAPLWDRYRAVAETIVGTIEPVRPVAPSSGDRGRPACTSDQWRLFHPGGTLLGDLAQRYVLVGGVEFRGGPPCHLRLTLRLEVVGVDGRRLPLPGNPSTTTVEGDLPEDRHAETSPLNWSWGWQEWCNRDVPEGRMRVSADGGATITVPGPPSPSTPGEPDTGCRDRGRPSTVAPFP
jgi:hypothetical protein